VKSPRLRCVRMEEQIGEQGLEPRIRGARQRLAVEGQTELTQEADLERTHVNPTFLGLAG
jgi:hypothetical protein